MSRESWPELVGLGWREAEKKIRKEYPNMCIQVLAESSAHKKEYCEERVRLFLDKDDKIAQTPKIG